MNELIGIILVSLAHGAVQGHVLQVSLPRNLLIDESLHFVTHLLGHAKELSCHHSTIIPQRMARNGYECSPTTLSPKAVQRKSLPLVLSPKTQIVDGHDKNNQLASLREDTRKDIAGNRMELVSLPAPGSE